jgi:phosphoribosylaminoimidazole-succinocarboxamide synthase
MQPILKTELEGVKLQARGKVRDIYDLGDRLLFVSTDRISAFDCILPNGIPGKGMVLNLLSEYWFRQSESYLAGSGWKEYRDGGTLAGEKLPEGLRAADRLATPVFHPAVKAHHGHDENITFAELEGRVGGELAARLRDASLRLYGWGAAKAEAAGVILVDTKFEFGLLDGDLILADELFTPDSSRFWRRDEYTPGRQQEAFDKQFVRDYLETLEWNKQPPAPMLPEEVVRETAGRYREIFRLLTGREAP